MSSLIVNGKTYIRPQDAASKAGISADYIRRLCRAGNVDGKLVEGVWHVNEQSLAQFVARKDEAKRERAAQQAQHLKEQRRKADAFARRAQRVRNIPQIALAALAITVLLGTATFAFSTPIPNSSPALASVASAVPAPVRATIDRAAASVYNFFCPFVSDCGARASFASATPSTSTTPTPTQQLPARTVQEKSKPQQPEQTIINQPVIERVVEKVQTIVQSGIDAATLDARFKFLEDYLSARIDLVRYEGERQTEELADDLSGGIGGAGFDDIDITGSTFTGGSISGASISGGSLSGVAFSGETDFAALTVAAATSTNATSTNLYVSGSFGFGSGTGVLQAASGAVSPIANGSAGQVLKIVGGVPTWSTDLAGSGGGSSFFSTTTDSLAIYPADPSHVVIVGASATTTTGNILEVGGNSLFRGTATTYGLLNAPRFTATSSVASVFPYASTTAISSSYSSSTQGFFGSLSVGSLSGFLRATAGSIAAAAIDLASDVTGILTVNRGGTGWANFASAAIPYGNGSGALATTSAGTNGQMLALLSGVPTWTATSTLSTISGTLGVDKGGSGATSFGYGLVLSPGGTTALTNIATSSLGLITTHVAEGSNLYYQDAHVQTYLDGIHKGFFFSTTSADYWGSIQGYATFAYPFPGNGTSTTLTFSGGLLSLASTTIGNGSQAGGLTVSGGATTTGLLHVLGMGTSSFASNLDVSGNLAVGANNILLNGVATSTFTQGIDIASGCFSISGACIGDEGTSNAGVVLSAVHTGTSTTDWTKPSDFTYIVVELWGGGGAGGDGDGSQDGVGGGGAGGYAQKRFTSTDLVATSSVRIVVGTGGTVNASAAGGAGTDTNFGGLATSTGGLGGSRTANNNAHGGAGGTGIGGDINLTGGGGGGGGGGSALNHDSGVGGSAPRGGGGGFSGTTASDGSDYGGGGGGGQATAGGGGAGGYVIYEYTTTGLSVGSVGEGTQGQISFYDATGRDITATSSLFISQSGNVGIGTTSPWKTLSIVGTMSINGLTLNTGAASASVCLSSTNEVTRNTDNESCITSSARYKHDIQSLIGTSTMETLLALRPVSFEYNETPGIRYGLIAEEVDAIDPTLVGYDDHGQPNSVRYTSVIPLLIQVIKDLIYQVRDLATAVANLAERITTKQVTTHELCVSDGANDNAPVCLTKSQLNTLLSQPAVADIADPSPPDDPLVHEPATSTEPIVHEPEILDEISDAAFEPADGLPPEQVEAAALPPTDAPEPELTEFAPEVANDNAAAPTAAAI